MKTIVFLFLFLALPAAAWAEKVALVIGNSEYEHVGRLPNPKNDAKDVAAALERIGFDVTSGIDLDYRGMRLAVRDFAQAARGADVVFVYYAGHGIEIDNTNYLIPVNAELKSDIDVQFEAIRFDQVLDAISASQGLRIVLVDACRNNPFIAEMTRTSSTRSIGRGLARVDPTGVMVGYSARGGTLALDGDGRNSPYTEALLSHIEEPGLELGKMFRKIRDDVYDATDGFQEPFVYGSLPGRNIYLVPAALQATDSETTTDVGADASIASSRTTAADALLKEAMDTTNAEAKLSLLNTLARLYPETGAGTTARFLAATIKEREQPEQAENPEESTVALDAETTTAEPLSAESNAKATEAALGLEKTDYQRIQRALNTLGYNVGSEDGIFGPRSRSGLTKYQQENRQEGSGFLTTSAVSALRAVPLPRRAEPATNEFANNNNSQTASAGASATAVSAAANAKRFIGNLYCLRDGRGVWDGVDVGDYRIECLRVKSASSEAVTYVSLVQKPRIWRIHENTITGDANRFSFPSKSNSQLRLDGKLYVLSQGSAFCKAQGKC